MSEKFRGKYRNESARRPAWDYGNDGAYFITICTKAKAQLFGQIKNGQMQVSPAGAIAHVLWHEIKNHAKNIALGEFIVMPNHVHGILILDGNKMDDSAAACIEEGSGPADPSKNDRMAAISPKSNTISSIIRSYKSAVTKYCNRLQLPMAWHPRFHDHIIRDDASFQRISEYIRNNPAAWEKDKFY